MTHFTMNDGVTIPALGLGTWMISQEKQQELSKELSS